MLALIFSLQHLHPFKGKYSEWFAAEDTGELRLYHEMLKKLVYCHPTGRCPDPLNIVKSTFGFIVIVSICIFHTRAQHIHWNGHLPLQIPQETGRRRVVGLAAVIDRSESEFRSPYTTPIRPNTVSISATQQLFYWYQQFCWWCVVGWIGLRDDLLVSSSPTLVIIAHRLLHRVN